MVAWTALASVLLYHHRIFGLGARDRDFGGRARTLSALLTMGRRQRAARAQRDAEQREFFLAPEEQKLFEPRVAKTAERYGVET
jgi:hypothetical protein